MTANEINNGCRDKFWERRRDDAVASAVAANDRKWRAVVEKVRKKCKDGYICSYYDAHEDGIGSNAYDAGVDAALDAVLAEKK